MRTLSLHAQLQALLEAAVLAVVPRALVHHTDAIPLARVHKVLLHSALEEAFTSLAAEHRVVVARTDVPTDHTHLGMNTGDRLHKDSFSC